MAKRNKFVILGIIPVAIIILLLALTSCGPSESDISQAVQTAYQQGLAEGTRKAVAEISNAGDSFRGGLREKMEVRLIAFSIVAVLLSLVGANIANWLRAEISGMFHLTVQQQLVVARWIYGIMAVGLMLVGIFADTASFWPLGILLFGSVIPFWEYLEALRAGDKIRMKIAVSKVKSLLFLSLVVVIIFRILGDSGIFGLRIGK